MLEVLARNALKWGYVCRQGMSQEQETLLKCLGTPSLPPLFQPLPAACQAALGRYVRLVTPGGEAVSWHKEQCMVAACVMSCPSCPSHTHESQIMVMVVCMGRLCRQKEEAGEEGQ